MKRNLRDLLLLILPVLGLLNSGCPGKSPAPTSPGPSGPPTFSYGVSFGVSGGTPMNTPNGLAVSGSNLWVANQYIIGFVQEWTTAGSETFSSTTYNSTGYNFPRDAAAGPDGYIYIADGSHLVVELTSAGGYVTVFGTAELGTDYTDGVAVGSTKAYLLDYTVPPGGGLYHRRHGRHEDLHQPGEFRLSRPGDHSQGNRPGRHGQCLRGRFGQRPGREVQ